MAVQDYKINYKSDFVLNINGDAGWAIPFCIKFWTGMPSQAYFVGFDGVKYVNCRVGDTPTQLLVMFDDHHLPIGPLKMQIAYHTTIEEFPGSVFDEVTNARDVIVTIDGTDYQVMLDFTGEDAPELEFDLPAYANEAERIQNELQRQQNEADRIAAELQREQATAAAVQGAENVNAQLNGTTLTVTNRNGVSTSVNTKGEQGEQGPVGPEGPQGETGISIVSFTPKSETSTTLIYTVTFSDGHTQDVAIPKGAKGDTGATGPQGPQGDTGVSITGMVETGETTTATLYNITFSNGTTQQIAIPKGAKGDTGNTGPQGPQGPNGDTGATGPQGPQGERGLPGESGVTGDVSGFTVIQTIDPSATYGATDIAGAATVQATNQELTELSQESTKSFYDDSDADLNIGDIEGNVILSLKNGGMRTKDFDSSKTLCSAFDNTNSDLNIGDEKGNVILSIQAGAIKTKIFDSSKVLKYAQYSEGLQVFDIQNIECSPLGVSAVPPIADAGTVPDVSILRDGYGCLYLPENYSPEGEPVRLILFATGGHTFLDKEHGWMPSAQPWTDTIIKDLTDRGYAVFGASVPGVTYQQWLANGKYGVPMGLPDIMECSYRAYQYIVSRYNVSKEIYIWGCSEGGLLALNWAYSHSDIVAAIAHCAGCVSIYSEWVSYGSWDTLRKRVANILGFSDQSGIVSSYEPDKANVFDPYTRLTTIDAQQYISWHTPIKFFWGTSDDVLTTDSIVGQKYQYIVNYHNAIRNSGGISFLKWYDGYNHEDVAMGRQQSVREDVINWFNHF